MPELIRKLIDMAELYFEDGAPHTAADRLQAATDQMRGLARQRDAALARTTALKPLDTDLAWAIEFVETEAELATNLTDYECDGLDHRRLETTLRRLVREAGYALPECTEGRGA